MKSMRGAVFFIHTFMAPSTLDRPPVLPAEASPRVVTPPPVRRGGAPMASVSVVLDPNDGDRRGPARSFVEKNGGDVRHYPKGVASGIRERLDAVLNGTVSHVDFSPTAARWLVKKAPDILSRRLAIIVMHAANPEAEVDIEGGSDLKGSDFGETLVALDYDKGIVRVCDVVRGQVIRVYRVPFVSFPRRPDDPAEIRRLAETNELGFQHRTTKAMVGAMFREGRWSDIVCMPVGTYPIAPMADRYGQVIFGGSRAIQLLDGRIALFRPDFHANRFVANADRLMMEHSSPDQIIAAYEQLVRANREYVLPPHLGGLYLAPGLRPTDELLGVGPGKEYIFTCEAIPAGKIYSSPLRVTIENSFHRAARGGVGNIKAAGNYAPTFRVKHEAREKGFHDVLFLDSSNHDIAELTSSNMFFIVRMGDQRILVTPPFSDGNVLNGCTRDSILQMRADLIAERVVDGSMEHPVIADCSEMPFARNLLGHVIEAFACGTGVTMQGIEMIDDRGDDPHTTNRDYHFDVSCDGMGPVTYDIHRRFLSILRGEKMEHPVYGSWLHVVEM